ncbi:hypothetical protein ACFLVW_05415 [Chloroflexota bacterium]
MSGKKKTTIMITGKTRRQLADEMKVMELVEAQGIKLPEVKTCYLCKREEGQESVRVNTENDTVQLPPIELELYEIEMGEGFTFGYWLCSECALLLSELGTASSESE